MRSLRDLARDRALLIAVLVAALVRLAVFLGAMVWPIPNEQGAPVSPLLPQGYMDFRFYLDSLVKYAESPGRIVQDFLDFYFDPSSDVRFRSIISGPVFPLLIGVTGFSDGNYLPLALIYLALGWGLCTAWLGWLRSRKLGGWWLLVFAVLPNPIWFTLVVSPDLVFAAEFALFFFAYFSTSTSPWRRALWVGAFVLMLLTRPNSFSIVLFVFADMAITIIRRRRIAVWPTVGMCALLLVSVLYLSPSFLPELNKAGNVLEYFGATPAEYVAGIFSGLPAWIDRPLSWLALIGAKLMYLTGLRPTYGATADWLVLVRAAPGLILLPGLVALFVMAPRRQQLLIALYCLPFLIGPAQDRYYLAIYPFLFLYGARVWEGVAATVRGARLSSAPSRGRTTPPS